MKLLRDLDVSGKRVFVRADLDVPLDEGDIDAATRLTNLKPTIDNLIASKASQIIIAGHIDRPKGVEPDKSTKQLLEHLEKILGQQLAFKADFDQAVEGPIILFENLRFWPGEEANDTEFAKKLASLADMYVNEAFGSCHRAHASMVALPSILPHGAGLHLQKEVEELGRVNKSEQKPLIAIVGGAKIDTKVPVIEHLAKVADVVLVGGELPVDIKAKGMKFAPNVIVGELTSGNFEMSQEAIDKFKIEIAKAKMVVWNGPLGFIEKGYVRGTLDVAVAIFESGAYSIVGGGDSTTFLASQKLLSKFSFVSAGGGAMLELLAGHELPGLKALE